MAIDRNLKKTFSVCKPRTKQVVYNVKLSLHQVKKVIAHTGKKPNDFKEFVDKWGGHEQIYFEINRTAWNIAWKRRFRPDLLIPLRKMEQWERDFAVSSKLPVYEIALKLGIQPYHVINIRAGEASLAKAINTREKALLEGK